MVGLYTCMCHRLVVLELCVLFFWFYGVTLMLLRALGHLVLFVYVIWLLFEVFSCIPCKLMVFCAWVLYSGIVWFMLGCVFWVLVCTIFFLHGHLLLMCSCAPPYTWLLLVSSSAYQLQLPTSPCVVPHFPCCRISLVSIYVQFSL